MDILSNLPSVIKQTILEQLQANNFIEAKKIYDTHLYQLQKQAAGLPYLEPRLSLQLSGNE